MSSETSSKSTRPHDVMGAFTRESVRTRWFARPLQLCVLAGTVLGAGPALAVSTSIENYIVMTGELPRQQLIVGSPGSLGEARGKIEYVNDFTGFTRSEAVANPGILRATSAVQANGISAGANSIARWSDAFAITSPNHAAGEVGTFSGSLIVEGVLSSVGINSGYAVSLVDVNALFNPNTGFNGGLTAVGRSARWDFGSDIGNNPRGPWSFVIDYTVPFTFGRDVNLAVSLLTSASALGIAADGGSYVAGALYGDTLKWGGMSAVHDAAGNLVTSYSALSSTSGFNYAIAAVPEPQALWMMVVGVALICSRYTKVRRMSDVRASRLAA